MARRRQDVEGATARPDIDPALLDAHEAVAIERGFEIEDADLAPPVSLAGAEAFYGRLDRVRLTGVPLTDSRLRGVALRDVVVAGSDGANADWTEATCNRVEFTDCRMTGMDLAEADLRDVTFRDCKLDYVNFRMARLAGVTFEDCVLVDADFGGARMEQVRFPGCELRQVEFTNARLAQVDLRGAELSTRGSATALRGAIVTPLQLMELAPVLAAEAGIRVED